MRQLRHALDASATTGNWYAALCLALILPDICARIEYPANNNSHRRYADWFDRYVRPKYTRQIGIDRTEHVFLGGNDCYALRCALLHEGRDDITTQRAREVLERFHFVVVGSGGMIHCNQFDNQLQLQVEIFCRDIADGVDAWLVDAAEDARKMRDVASGLLIQDVRHGAGFRI